MKRTEPDLYERTKLVMPGNPRGAEAMVRQDVVRKGVGEHVNIAGYLPEAGGHAIFFSPTDADSLCRRMVEVVRHPELTKGMVEEGKRYADSLTWERAAGVLAGIFRTFLAAC